MKLALIAIALLICTTLPSTAQTCSLADVLKRMSERREDLVGQGWRSPRQYPWHLGNVHGAMFACRTVAKGPKWRDLELRAAAFRHENLHNSQLMENGRNALVTDHMRIGMECQCALAIDAFGPRGYDLDGVLDIRQ